jgi:hypothetical protein
VGQAFYFSSWKNSKTHAKKFAIIRITDMSHSKAWSVMNSMGELSGLCVARSSLAQQQKQNNNCNKRHWGRDGSFGRANLAYSDSKL